MVRLFPCCLRRWANCVGVACVAHGNLRRSAASFCVAKANFGELPVSLKGTLGNWLRRSASLKGTLGNWLCRSASLCGTGPPASLRNWDLRGLERTGEDWTREDWRGLERTGEALRR